MDPWVTIIGALAAAAALVLGAMKSASVLDMARERFASGDARRAREDDVEAEVRTTLWGTVRQLQAEALERDRRHGAEIRELRGRLDVLATQLADTRVELAEARTAREAEQKLYEQVVESHRRFRSEHHDCAVQLNDARKEIEMLRKQLGST